MPIDNLSPAEEREYNEIDLQPHNARSDKACERLVWLKVKMNVKDE